MSMLPKPEKIRQALLRLLLRVAGPAVVVHSGAESVITGINRAVE